MIFVIRLLVSILWAAHLDTSSDYFKMTVSNVLSREDQKNSEDGKHCEIFLLRVRENPLAAEPLNLYRTKPSLLLTLANLIITYVVILLQSK